VIADPARSGLGADGVRAVTGTGADLCVLVSCDPGALGRDAALLVRAGYRHVGSTVVDLFGHASHIEVVSGFQKRPDVGTGSP
jgi:23S rRNA (uracil1939-C5)-methyltransferase